MVGFLVGLLVGWWTMALWVWLADRQFPSQR